MKQLALLLLLLVLAGSIVPPATPRGTAQPASHNADLPAAVTADAGPFLGASHEAVSDIVDGGAAAKPDRPAGGAPQPAVATANPRLTSEELADGAITTAIWTASATWCKPTPTQCRGWEGDALLAALPTFRWGQEQYRVRVSRGERSVVVTVVSWCGCGIDVSPAAFEELAPLSRGRLDVTVEGPVE